MKISKFLWRDIMRCTGLKPFDNRPGLKVTTLTVRNGRLLTTSLNEQTIVHQYGDVLDGVEGESISIDLTQIPRTRGDVELKLHGDQVMLLADGEMWTIPVPEVAQPDFTRVELCATADRMWVTFDPKVLLKALEALKDERTVVLRLRDPLKPVVLEGSHSRAVVLPVRHYVGNEEQIAWKERDHGEPATL